MTEGNEPSNACRARADAIMFRARMAAAVFNQLDQEHTDRIVAAVARAGFDHRVRLARMAREETDLGIWQDKVIKNVLATLLVYENIRAERTVGILSHDELSGITELAQPLGPIFAMTPVTNPTSTTLFKILICLKTRNPIIVSPHPRSIRCVQETARICSAAAMEQEAPEDCIQVVTEGSREMTRLLMGHHDTALILATGGTGLIRAASSSGTPALGVGPGNVPVLIDPSADIPFAVRNIVLSKTFDNGTLYASEQAVVIERSIAAVVYAEFERQGAYFCGPAEIAKLAAVAIDPSSGGMRPDVVGQPAAAIAERAGLKAPAGTRLLIAPLTRIGPEEPLSGEVLAPILALYQAADAADAVKLCLALNYRGQAGHTAGIYANDDRRIDEFGRLMNAGRVVVNTPASQGALGGVFNRLMTSYTLGCGIGGKNVTTENISARHLLNIKRICRRRCNENWFGLPTERLLDETLNSGVIWAEYKRNH